MNVDAKIIIAAILLCIVIAGIVLLTPVQPNQIEAIAESASAIITAASIIILVRHNRETAKQNTEAITRSEWAILHAERQRLESDYTQLRLKDGEEGWKSRKKQIRKRTKEVSAYMSEMLKQYGGIFPNLAYFTLKDESNKEQ